MPSSLSPSRQCYPNQDGCWLPMCLGLETSNGLAKAIKCRINSWIDPAKPIHSLWFWLRRLILEFFTGRTCVVLRGLCCQSLNGISIFLFYEWIPFTNFFNGVIFGKFFANGSKKQTSHNRVKAVKQLKLGVQKWNPVEKERSKTPYCVWSYHNLSQAGEEYL